MKLSTRLAWRVGALCALFAFLVLLGIQAPPVSAASPSFIRLINASPDVGTVDAFVDGAKFLENTRFATVTDYLQLPARQHRMELALVGKGVGAAVIVQTLSVQAGTAYTVAAVGTKSRGFSLQVFIDDNLMASGMAKVRVYDLSPHSGSLSVEAGANKPLGTLSFRQASNYRSLATGLYTLTVSSSRPAFTLTDQVTLKTDTVISLFLVGVVHGTPLLQVVQVQVRGLPSMSGTGSDPNTLPVNAWQITPLAVLPFGALALAIIGTGWLSRLWPSTRRNGRGGPAPLYWSVLAMIVALALSAGGLSLASVTTHPAPRTAERLLIPAIGVNAAIESIGIRPGGTMETPSQSPWNDVGLYNAGPRPGERGSAVIAGHLDRPGGNPAVFWRLRDLHVGDEVQVVDTQGKVLRFHVTRIESFPPQNAPVQDVFGNTSGRFLNLTTCAGDWIPTERQTSLRLVLYTSLTAPPQNGLSIAGTYNGSMYDETRRQITSISVLIERSEGSADFSGTFAVTSPSRRAYPLSGKVDLRGNFSFTIQQPAGQLPLYFYGTVQHKQGGDYLHGYFCRSSTHSCSANTGYFTVGPRY